MDNNSLVVNRLEKELFVIFLACVANQTNQEIARVMGISPNRVSQIKRKGLVRVKHLYRRYTCEN